MYSGWSIPHSQSGGKIRTLRQAMRAIQLWLAGSHHHFVCVSAPNQVKLLYFITKSCYSWIYSSLVSFVAEITDWQVVVHFEYFLLPLIKKYRLWFNMQYSSCHYFTTAPNCFKLKSRYNNLFLIPCKINFYRYDKLLCQDLTQNRKDSWASTKSVRNLPVINLSGI